MRRLLTFMILIAIAVTPLFASGQQQSEPAATDSDHPFGPEMTITFTGIYDVPPDPDGSIMQVFEERYNTVLEYINVERSNYNEMLALKITTGEIPDTFVLDGNMLQYRSSLTRARSKRSILTWFRRLLRRSTRIRNPTWTC